jgi:CIC family chloride channel protein
MKNADIQDGIPISPLLNNLEIAEGNVQKTFIEKSRLLTICIYAVTVAIAISFIAKVLVSLINMVTNI